MAGRWCRKTHQNMWVCASMPVFFYSHYRGLLFRQVFPSLCQTIRTHGSVCSVAGSVPRGRLTRTRRDCWHCCHSERRRVSSAQALWSRSHTTSAVWMFHFSNTRHTASHPRHRATCGICVRYLQSLLEYFQSDFEQKLHIVFVFFFYSDKTSLV